MFTVLKLGVGLLALHFSAAVFAHAPAEVTLGSTVITGVTQDFNGISVDFFGGIPFAEPPLGALRFAPPVPLNRLENSTFDASHFGAVCAQLNFTGSSEDCLNLNVFRPAGISDSASLPVMVWIYGGGFMEGHTIEYNATQIIIQSVLRDTPVIYVSFNYRLGPFGFPQGAEAETRGALNLGRKDQLLALQWIQDHIHLFGGDPRKVTVFGESAGAISIANLYLNSGLERLARATIMESGMSGTLPVFNASQNQAVWDSFISNIPECVNTSAAGISIPCAQNVSTETLLDALNQTNTTFGGLFVFVPVLDGTDGIIPALPALMIAEGNYSKIPYIAGQNLDEGTLFIPKSLNTTEQLVALFTGEGLPITGGPPPPDFEAAIQRMLELYPDNPALGSPFGTGNETFGAGMEYKRAAAMLTDLSFTSLRRNWTQTTSAEGVPAFGYIFADQHAALQDPSLGVTHSRELTYVYGYEAVSNPDASVRLLSLSMVDYWISFAVSMTPNDGKGIRKSIWPQYTTYEPNLLQLDPTTFTNASFANLVTIPDTFRAEQVSFIESVATVFSQ